MPKRKKHLINTSKQKLNMDKLKPKTVVISTLNHSRKEKLPVLIPEVEISTFATKEVDIAMISTNVYYAIYKLK